MEEEKIKYSLLFSGIIIFSFLFVGLTKGDKIITYNQPVIETAPLKQNGSLASPYIYNLTGDYSFVTKIHWVINFDTNSIIFSNFGDGSALTNGIEVLYDGVSLVGGDVVKTNAGFVKFSYNSFVFSDEKNPKTRIVDTQWLLTSFILGGIEITASKTIQIYIRDNIAGYTSINNFTATFKGYKIIQEQIFNPEEPRNDPLDVLGLFWRDNGPTLEGLAISLIGFVIVIVFWRRRS